MKPGSRQFVELVRTILDTVRDGGRIYVIGWKASNHSKFTLALEQANIVNFTIALPISASHDHFWLFTKFITHGKMNIARREGARMVNFVLGVGEIKRLLEPLSQYLPTLEKKMHRESNLRGSVTRPLAPPTEIRSDLVPAVLQTEMASSKDSPEESSLRSFATEFVKAVNHDPQGSLTKYQISEIVEAHFGKKATASRLPELLVPLVKEGGKKAGRYKATSRLLELATRPSNEEPNDPIEKARWLVGQRAKLLRSRDEYAEKIVEINGILERVEKAAHLLQAMSEI